MTYLTGARNRTGAKINIYTTDIADLQYRDVVVVETNGGYELSQIVTPPYLPGSDACVETLKRVVRIAGASDRQQAEQQSAREQETLQQCKRLARKLGLPMKLVSADFTLDGSHVTINFASENRVDFRELVRELAHCIKARILFHQIGVRDHARAVGTMGHCGQQLCCARFLTSLEPIAVKMAKDQSLAINPSKFSGICGKLMCCLRYEHGFYQERLQHLPEAGDTVETPRGPGVVLDINVLMGRIKARLEDGAEFEYDAVIPQTPCDGGCPKATRGGNGHNLDNEASEKALEAPLD